MILIVSGVGALVAGAMALHIPPASLSRVSAYDWFGSLLCEPLALALAGVAAAAIEMSTTLWIAAAVDLAAVAAMLGHRAHVGYGESTNPSSSRVHKRSRPAEIGRVRPVFGDTSPVLPAGAGSLPGKLPARVCPERSGGTRPQGAPLTGPRCAAATSQASGPTPPRPRA